MTPWSCEEIGQRSVSSFENLQAGSRSGVAAHAREAGNAGDSRFQPRPRRPASSAKAQETCVGSGDTRLLARFRVDTAATRRERAFYSLDVLSPQLRDFKENGFIIAFIEINNFQGSECMTRQSADRGGNHSS